MESIERASCAAAPAVLVAAAVITTALPASALANAAGMFESLDQDENGSLVRDELAAHAALVARFSRADDNRDGALSLAEFERLLALPGAVPTLE